MTGVKHVLARFRSLIRDFLPRRIESESKLIRDAQSYWTDPNSTQFASNSHWQGTGPFENRQLWINLGRQHFALVQRLQSWAGSVQALNTVVEWGCGGGMNAVQFAPAANSYYGIDISEASLNECARQVGKICSTTFEAILIDAATPEMVVQRIPLKCDLFLCTYVFELLPTPEYGLRILRIAATLLDSGGIALIQIRYSDGTREQSSKHHSYAENLAEMTTYLLDDFWIECNRAGLEPLFTVLVPQQPELREKRYAYFGLRRRA